jgi:hypothetical protein
VKNKQLVFLECVWFGNQVEWDVWNQVNGLAVSSVVKGNEMELNGSTTLNEIAAQIALVNRKCVINSLLSNLIV